MTENWLLILLVVAGLAVTVWWLVRRPASSDGAAPTLDRRDASRPIDRDATGPVVVEPVPDIAPEPPIPVVIGSAGSPLDVAPPPVPVADDARVTEPEPAREDRDPADHLIDADPLHAPSGDDGVPEDLTVLKGVGPKLATRLGELGVTRLSQVAAWSDDDVARIDAQLGNFRGRPMRDRWVEQAGLLAAGDRKGYEERFGRIET